MKSIIIIVFDLIIKQFLVIPSTILINLNVLPFILLCYHSCLNLSNFGHASSISHLVLHVPQYTILHDWKTINNFP